jgi:hypothetical protein
MNRESYRALCRDFEAGRKKYVENPETREIGRVTACGEQDIEIEAGGKSASWPVANCVETTESRFHHKERTLDTRPWDVDRFNPYT